jgi:hypothetical protein
MLRRFVVASLMMFALAVPGLVAVAPSAVAQPTATAQFAARATLLAKGAGVAVRVRYTCSSSAMPQSVDVQLTQRVGRRVAQGHGFVGGDRLICDDIRHTIVVNVTTSSGVPFRTGVAFALGHFAACDQTGCTEAFPDREIQIVKR